MDIYLTCKENHDDIASSFDKYYEGGDSSLYNKRLGKNRLLYREKQVLFAIAKKAVKNLRCTNGIFRILDFGCGDGRFFSAIVLLAKFFNRHGVKLEVTSYDPSLTGLINYRKVLINSGFKSIKPSMNAQLIANNGYLLDCLDNDLLSIKLLHGVIRQEPEEIKALLGKKDYYDVVISMFGVLSHIAGRNNRVAIKRMFNELLKVHGSLIISLPMLKDFKQEYIAFQLIREHNRLLSRGNLEVQGNINYLLELAQEDGDIYYCKYDDKNVIKIFYHIYKIDEILKDLKDSCFIENNVGVCCVWHPSKLSTSRLKRFGDYILSKILSSSFCPFALKEKFASYVMVISEKGS